MRANSLLTVHDIQYHPDGWGNDYSIYRGYSVTTTGTVTTPLSYNTAYGAFAIQDAAQRWSGVYIRGAQQEINQGDVVTVTGTVFERDPNDPVKWEYETFIQATNIQVTAHGHGLPAAIVLQDATDITFNGGSESLEGVLVKLRNVTLDDMSAVDPTTTNYWPITDASLSHGWLGVVGLNAGQVAGKGFRNDWTTAGTNIAFIEGILSENFGHYAIQLRDTTAADIGPWAVTDPNDPTPHYFALNAAYPNPFNATTTISFSLPRAGLGELALFDLEGRLVGNLASGRMSAGSHTYSLDASALATGVYIVKLQAAGQTATQKLVLMK